MAMTIHDLMRSIDHSAQDNEEKMDSLKTRAAEITDRYKNGQATSDADKIRLDSLFKDIDNCRAARKRINARMADAKKVAAEEAEYETRIGVGGTRLEKRDGKTFYTDENGDPYTGEFVAHGSAAPDKLVRVKDGLVVEDSPAPDAGKTEVVPVAGLHGAGGSYDRTEPQEWTRDTAKS